MLADSASLDVATRLPSTSSNLADAQLSLKPVKKIPPPTRQMGLKNARGEAVSRPLAPRQDLALRPVGLAVQRATSIDNIDMEVLDVDFKIIANLFCEPGEEACGPLAASALSFLDGMHLWCRLALTIDDEAILMQKASQGRSAKYNGNNVTADQH